MNSVRGKTLSRSIAPQFHLFWNMFKVPPDLLSLCVLRVFITDSQVDKYTVDQDSFLLKFEDSSLGLYTWCWEIHYTALIHKVWRISNPYSRILPICIQSQKSHSFGCGNIWSLILSTLGDPSIVFFLIGAKIRGWSFWLTWQLFYQSS